MKSTYLIIAFTVLTAVKSFSQINYERGYIINNKDEKTECLIKNMDWRSNPTSIEYKTIDSGDVMEGDINSIKEFGIYGIFKFFRAEVEIDRSTDNINDLKKDRNPLFGIEQLFLKVLIEGKASLYSYVEGRLNRFYFQMNGQKIEPLVYKRYLKDSDIAYNNHYRQQVFQNLKCDGIKLDDIQSLKYSANDLEDIFKMFNKCVNSEYKYFSQTTRKDLINLWLRPGFVSSSLEIDNSSSNGRDADFGRNGNFRLGLEFEYILSYNKNKWSLFIEPTYQYYEAEKTTSLENIDDVEFNSMVNYSSIELPLGMRHYMFLGQKSKLFVNAAYVIDLPINSSIETTQSDGNIIEPLDISASGNLAFGFGFNYDGRYNVELRYQTSRDILDDYITWKAEYQSLSIIIGYSFF